VDVPKVTIPQFAWHGTRELELTLPDSWEVAVCRMAGYRQPKLTPEAMKAAIACPVGTPPIREMAKGKQEVVIIFDDMTRVTRTAEIAPLVLEELALAGVPDNRIRFIAALGTHGALTRAEFVKKLGEATLARFPVYNHDLLAKGTYVGTTSYGTKVFLNAEVMRCDLKIGIGTVTPHRKAGFGGGGKIILPGIASFATIKNFHILANAALRAHPEKPVIGMGIFEGNPMRLNSQEAALMAGLDVKIDCLHNQMGETVAIYTGALIPTSNQAAEDARKHYLTPKARDAEVVIANAFTKASEAGISLSTALASVNPNGGDIVLVCNAPEGQVPHYLLGSFGNHHFSRLRSSRSLPSRVRNLIIFTDYPDLAGYNSWLEKSDRVRVMNRWPEVLEFLTGHHGEGTRAAVYPTADSYYFA